MRIKDLYSQLNEADIGRVNRAYDYADSSLPDNHIKHSMPRTLIFPDMDGYYEFYKFAVALACHPELDPAYYKDRNLRDVPLAVAYTEEEYEMIKNVAKRLGKEVKEIAYQKSKEHEDVYTKSPVMQFKMTEAHIDCMKSLMEIWEK